MILLLVNIINYKIHKNMHSFFEVYKLKYNLTEYTNIIHHPLLVNKRGNKHGGAKDVSRQLHFFVY